MLNCSCFRVLPSTIQLRSCSTSSTTFNQLPVVSASWNQHDSHIALAGYGITTTRRNACTIFQSWIRESSTLKPMPPMSGTLNHETPPISRRSLTFLLRLPLKWSQKPRQTCPAKLSTSTRPLSLMACSLLRALLSREVSLNSGLSSKRFRCGPLVRMRAIYFSESLRHFLTNHRDRLPASGNRDG